MIAIVMFHLDDSLLERVNPASESFWSKLKKQKQKYAKVRKFISSMKLRGITGAATGSVLFKQKFIDISDNTLKKIIYRHMPKEYQETGIAGNKLRSVYFYDRERPSISKRVFNSSSFKNIRTKVHELAQEYVSKNMPELLTTFNELFPINELRYIFASMYTAGRRDVINIHQDVVSFFTIVISIEGDYKEPDGNCFHLSPTMQTTDGKVYRLQNGDALLFERHYHYIPAVQDRQQDRLSLVFLY